MIDTVLKTLSVKLHVTRRETNNDFLTTKANIISPTPRIQ